MAVTLNAHATAITRDDLKKTGMSDEAVDQLQSLREKYPFAEFLDSEVEWQRLVFLKWLCEKGRVSIS